MTEHRVDASMSREQILNEVLAMERETHELLEMAAQLTKDPEERALFQRLARRGQGTLDELRREEERLDAEDFVQRALDC